MKLSFRQALPSGGLVVSHEVISGLLTSRDRTGIKTLMRYWGLLLVVLFVGCAQNRTTVQSENGVDFGRYRRIGVLPFTDRRGQGERIAAAVETGLRGLNFEVADSKVLEKILSNHNPDAFFGIDLDTLEQIRTKTSTDAIIFGAMAPDWHQATIALIDMEQGDTVLRATLRPGRGKKTFTTPDEVVVQTIRIFDMVQAPSNH